MKNNAKPNTLIKTLMSAGPATLTALTCSVSLLSQAQTPPSLDLHMYAGLTITGSVGSVYMIQYTTDLAATNAWVNLADVLLPSSPYLWVDKSAPASGQRFYRAASSTDLAQIPAGTFIMGSPSTEQDRSPDEGPQMAVTLTRSFWIGKYLITQADYAKVIINSPVWDPYMPKNNMTWELATNYCAQLTQQARADGRIPPNWVYRLPTEAEWEYACRAGTTTRFSYGDDPTYANLGQYSWNHDNGGYQVHEVGFKQPNPWGLYDTAGDLWEWCQDWYGSYPGGTQTDPQGPSSGSRHVLRGGGYYSYGQFCRSAFRAFPDPLGWTFAFGFRVVLAPL